MEILLTILEGEARELVLGVIEDMKLLAGLMDFEAIMGFLFFEDWMFPSGKLLGFE